MVTIEGHLERITYYNKENHYTIARLKTIKTNNPVTVVGFMPAVQPGESLKIKGTWETHPRYGQQLKINSFEVILPATINSIKHYLESGFIKGIGPKTVDALINRFKDRTLEIIENAPDKLIAVKGIGKVKAAQITTSWQEHHAIRRLMLFLQKNRITTSYTAKIFKEYGEDAVNIITSDPYRMANDLPGVGFYAADTIAQNLNIPKEDPKRIRACLRYLLGECTAEGHIFAYEEAILQRCRMLFAITPEKAMDALTALADQGEIVIERSFDNHEANSVYPRALHEAENGVANRIKALLSIPLPPPEIDAEQITAAVLKKLAINPSPEQLKVLHQALLHQVLIITGGPGTGKTTLIRSLNAVFELLGKQVILAAPTGRAARRLAELSRKEASTLHKLLGYSLEEGRFNRNQDNPLDADVVIVDEASMVDTLIMFHLLKAVSMHAVLILVGDAFQLPPVGPGNVLADLIKSKRIITFELKKIFRQAQKSPILINAHRIRMGERPDFHKTEKQDKLSEFYFIETSNPDRAVETIVELCSKSIPHTFGFDPIQDIQVLTPMHKGVIGTANLNYALQRVLNPQAVAATGGSGFRPGDKVMHLKNNYQKEIFNGDIGTISAIDGSTRSLAVDYYGKIVTYDFSELEELSLAYAITVHKSQGSEYPAVIIPIMLQHFALLHRTLLYTAITRGEKLVILLGSKKALDIALKNDSPRKRFSSLANRLMHD